MRDHLKTSQLRMKRSVMMRDTGELKVVLLQTSGINWSKTDDFNIVIIVCRVEGGLGLAGLFFRANRPLLFFNYLRPISDITSFSSKFLNVNQYI